MGIKENTIKQFGKQADAYSKGNIFVDGVYLQEIFNKSGVKKGHRVLDIATGAGFLAIKFAEKAGMVVGSDITRNMLIHAREKQKISGNDNADFILSDVELLPFPDGTFDIVSCRFAFHHFPDPVKALFEMKRVCRDRIVLIDGTSSEDRNKSDFHNRIENIRDPSHVRIYTLSEMKKMFNDAGTIISGISHRDIKQDFNEWMERSGTVGKEKSTIEELMLESIPGDSTGLRVRFDNGKLGFTYDTVILVADLSG